MAGLLQRSKLASLASSLQFYRLSSSSTTGGVVTVSTASFVLKRKVKLPHQPRPISPLVVGPFLKEYPRYKTPRPVGDRIYEEVEQTPESEPTLRILLLDTVDELGVPGDIVQVDRDYARYHLLSSRRAVYADEYNEQRYRSLIESGSRDRAGPSSAFVMPTIKRLSREVIIVHVNNSNRWTLSVDHVRIAFRSAGYFVPNECIELPVSVISGPDIERWQGKDVAVKVTVNERESVHVRCLLQHHGLPLRLDWDREPRFIALPDEQGELLRQMPVKEAIKEEDLI